MVRFHKVAATRDYRSKGYRDGWFISFRTKPGFWTWTIYPFYWALRFRWRLRGATWKRRFQIGPIELEVYAKDTSP